MWKKPLPKSVLKLLFFVVIGMAFFVMWGRQLPFDSKTKKGTGEKVVRNAGPVYSLEPIAVELAGRYLEVTKGEEGKRPQIGTRKKYLSMAVDLVLTNEKAVEELEKQLVQIRGAISEIASSNEVKDIENAEGKKALGNEIVCKVNGILQQDMVTKIFFVEFIIQ